MRILRLNFKPSFFWNDGEPWIAPADAIQEKVDEIVQKDMAREALSYCLGRWLRTYTTKVVHCYVDQFFHGGTTITSRLEGAHYVLKQWIRKPTKNLTAVWSAVQLAINEQLEEIWAKQAQCFSSTVMRLQNEFFSSLAQKITPQGQLLLYTQWLIYL